MWCFVLLSVLMGSIYFWIVGLVLREKHNVNVCLLYSLVVMLVSVDLDDTLLETASDYDRAAAEFGEFMSSEFGVSVDAVVEKRAELDFQCVEEHGMVIERHPQIFVDCLYEFVSDPSPEHILKAREYGWSIFKSETEYANRGFMAGSQRMLNCLQTIADPLVLVTVGDERCQQPKINALNLTQWFDEVHIASYENGKEAVFNSILDKYSLTPQSLVHIGNSASSDVEAVVEVGGCSIHISDCADWLSNEADHKKWAKHPRVYSYSSAQSFVPNIPEIFQYEFTQQNLSSRIV